LNVLLDVPLSYLEKVASPAVVQAIAKVRSGEVQLAPGYDGRSGQILIPRERREERPRVSAQISLF
jgi:PHP family Zn ribbon phosphoesterase